MEFGLDHLQYMQEHTGIALHSTRHTWRMVEAVPMPMFVAPQISVPIIARYMQFHVFPAAPTNGVSTAWESRATKLLTYEPASAALSTALLRARVM